MTGTADRRARRGGEAPRKSPQAPIIDLNSDLGEGMGTDADLLPYITSANVACGLHAGDAATIRQTVELARTHGVAIGAHPSFPDREGFGRRPMRLPPAKVLEIVADQIRFVARIARDVGTRLQHVKPHGALYNQAATDPALASAIADAVRQVDAELVVVALAGSPMVRTLQDLGLRVAQEAFIDRGYSPQGTLIPRDQAGALITDSDAAVRQAMRLARDHVVSTRNGQTIQIYPDTLCIHGDTPGASTLARAVRQALESAGVIVGRLDTPQ